MLLRNEHSNAASANGTTTFILVLWRKLNRSVRKSFFYSNSFKSLQIVKAKRFLFGKKKMKNSLSNFIDRFSIVNVHRSKPKQLQCDCCPCSRSGHRIFATNDYLYLIGGYDPAISPFDTFTDVWRFDLITEKWEQMNALNDSLPCCLASFSLVPIFSNGDAMLFGGTGYPFGERTSNELLRIHFNHTNPSFHTFETHVRGDEIPRLYGQAMVHRRRFDADLNAIVDVIYIIGGTTGHEYNIDVWRMESANTNLQEWECKLLTKSFGSLDQELPGRYRLEVVATEHYLITFGGGNPSFCAAFDNMLIFDLRTEHYVTISTKPDSRHGFPSSRKCHAIVEFDGCAYIIGGCHESFEDGSELRTILNDVWSLNLDTFAWTKMDAQLRVPVFFHAAAVTKEGCLYVYGGCTNLQSTNRTSSLQRMWLRPPTLRHFAIRSVFSTEKLFCDEGVTEPSSELLSEVAEIVQRIIN